MLTANWLSIVTDYRSDWWVGGGRRSAPVVEVSEWLASRGLQGLCHPTSEEYEPAFPICQTLPRQAVSRHLGDYYNDDGDVDVVYSDPPRNKWCYVFKGSMALLCVICGALAAGLTVGLLSIDPLLLVIKMRAGETEEEKRQAEQLLPLVKQHHRLLVTLLLLNTLAGESLPVFLQGMVGDHMAILISVVLVLVFGEILPTALFTGPNQIQVASHCAPLVKVLMVLMYPVTYPIARLLDRFMADENHDHGDEGHAPIGALYNRRELAALIRVQYEERLAAKQRQNHYQSSVPLPPTFDMSDINATPVLRQVKASLHRPIPSISAAEVMMVEGALQMKTKTALDIFLSFHKVFCIPYDMPLDEANIFTIYASGYSRVPVFTTGDRRLVKGILMTRQLMVVNQAKDEEHAPPLVSELKLHIPQCVAPDTNLVDLVNLFQTGGCAVRAGHMALVCARPDVAHEALERDEAVPNDAGLMGIITLEDVLEALLQESILDEMDAAGRVVQPVDAEGIQHDESDCGTVYRQLV
ncbi:hypothetical protein ACHAXR_004890 [Thalassiosira sp. AJA248-18]